MLIATINIIGGFMVTRRMLAMFKELMRRGDMVLIENIFSSLYRCQRSVHFVVRRLSGRKAQNALFGTLVGMAIGYRDGARL